MSKSLLKILCLILVFSGCTSSSRNSERKVVNENGVEAIAKDPAIAPDEKPASLLDLPQTEDGGFVLAPGYYETEFKTYCLQPGTPDPSQGDAYLQGNITGRRKEIIQTILLNSRNRPELDQRHVQLLLWSVVSGSDFNKLSPSVRADATKLLTPKQIFKLKGGVGGVIKTVASSTSMVSSNNDLLQLFEKGITSYESFEKLAVLAEPSQVKRKGVKYDQWYMQKENYYLRYFPVSYKKVRVQVYVPPGLLDAENKTNGEYIVFDPTGQQAIPAFTNAQRLGIGGPLLDVVRAVIKVSKKTAPPVAPKKLPQKRNPKTDS